MRLKRSAAFIMALTMAVSAAACTQDAAEEADAAVSSTQSSAGETEGNAGLGLLTETDLITAGDYKYQVYEKPIRFNFQDVPYEEWLSYESPFSQYVPLLNDDGSGVFDHVQVIAFALRYAYENDIEYIEFPIEYDAYELNFGWGYASLSFPNIPVATTGAVQTLDKDGYYQIHLSDSMRKASGKYQETIDAAKEIVESMPEELTSDIDKAYYLYDWVCRNVVYDYFHAENTGYVNNIPQSAYGALVEKRAVCDGIASAVQLLFCMAGIDCGKVNGHAYDDNGNITGHVWNYAFIGDEVWDFDATWDICRYYFDESDEITEGEGYGFYRWFGVERKAKTQTTSMSDIGIYNSPATTDIYSVNSPGTKIYDLMVSTDEEYNTTYIYDGKAYAEDELSNEEYISIIKDRVKDGGMMLMKFNNNDRLAWFIRNFITNSEPCYDTIDSNGKMIFNFDMETGVVALMDPQVIEAMIP
ncbi:MAG: transglutaminase domain-containing protein [Ruminococcus sp.]|nr:transglutaminase domain-containing protein [Ruminococcus sp.]